MATGESGGVGHRVPMCSTNSRYFNRSMFVCLSTDSCHFKCLLGCMEVCGVHGHGLPHSSRSHGWLLAFVGSVCRTETMRQLLCFKSKFSNHFAFTFGRYLFLLFLVKFIGFVCRTKTMHQLLYSKSKFPNHFAFTLGRYLFLLFWV